MKLTRKIKRDGNLYPVIINYLKTLPESALYNNHHKLRHPYSIYYRSLMKVLEAFDVILDELDQICQAPLNINNQDDQITYSLENLPKLQENLLHALLSHIDDCYNILKAIHPPSSLPNPSPFSDRWLDEVKHPTVKEFTNNIKTYRSQFAPIVNKIKHQGGELRCVVRYPINSGITIYDPITKISYCTNYYKAKMVGYFLEGITTDGCIGPDHELHPDYTAISFNYDLKYHFYHLYVVGLHLKTAIVNYLKQSYDISLDKPRNIEISSEDKVDLKVLVFRLSQLPSLYFRNEFLKPTADLVYNSKDNNEMLTLEYPSSYKLFWDGEIQMEFRGVVDYNNLSYKIIQ